MKNSMLILLLGITIAVIGLIVWLKPNSPDERVGNVTAVAQPSDVSDPVTSQGSVLVSNTAPNSKIFKTGLEQLPASLSGTEVDGELLIDENKNLHVTRGLRDLFDYFLATIGEESLPTIIERVKAYIRHRTPEPAQSQTIALFDQYIAYRAAIDGIPEAGGKSADQIDLDAVEQQKAAEQRLRKQFFDSKTIQAFFGDDDAYDQYSIQSLKIANNPQLSEAEKAQKNAELLRQLPDGLREALQDATRYQTLEQQTAAWQARGGSAAELRQIRIALVGPEAAGRLEALDQETDQWDRRIDAYIKAYNPIVNNPQWSAEQKQLMILSLRRQQGFSEQEQLRLPAFEQMAAEGIKLP